MFFAFFLELYSSSSYNKGRVVFAILRYVRKNYFLLQTEFLMKKVYLHSFLMNEMLNEMTKKSYENLLFKRHFSVECSLLHECIVWDRP